MKFKINNTTTINEASKLGFEDFLEADKKNQLNQHLIYKKYFKQVTELLKGLDFKTSAKFQANKITVDIEIEIYNNTISKELIGKIRSLSNPADGCKILAYSSNILINFNS